MTKTNTLPKKIRVAIPEGIASWPSLDSPNTNFDDDGVYCCDVVLDPDDPALKAFDRQLSEFGDKWWAQLIEEGAGVSDDTRFHLPIKAQKDKDKKPTGKMLVKAKMKAKLRLSEGEPSVDQRPLIVGPDARPMEPVPRIAGGSTVRVGADAKCTYMEGTDDFYVSLVLRSVQVIDLVEYGAVTEAQYADYGIEPVETPAEDVPY